MFVLESFLFPPSKWKTSAYIWKFHFPTTAAAACGSTSDCSHKLISISPRTVVFRLWPSLRVVDVYFPGSFFPPSPVSRRANQKYLSLSQFWELMLTGNFTIFFFNLQNNLFFLFRHPAVLVTWRVFSIDWGEKNRKMAMHFKPTSYSVGLWIVAPLQSMSSIYWYFYCSFSVGKSQFNSFCELKNFQSFFKWLSQKKTMFVPIGYN